MMARNLSSGEFIIEENILLKKNILRGSYPISYWKKYSND